MAEVKILIKGYASINGKKATSTTTLILDGKLKFVVDPGMDREKLLSGLKENNLEPNDINYVIQTHGHIDHVGLTAIFEKATVIDDEAFYTFDGGYVAHGGNIPESTLKILKTPGHDLNHMSVIVNTDKGKVVIAGDVFWWYDEEDKKTDYQSLMNRIDEWAKNNDDLKESRKKILAIADFVIPGHGEMFEVKK